LEWLRRELSDGAKEVVELHRAARMARVPIRSLTFSRKILAVEVRRDGERGAFLWELPKEKA
jgi:hypothetical protein